MFPQQDFFWTDPNFEERERRDERETEGPGSCCAGLVTRVSEGVQSDRELRQPDRGQVHCQPLSPGSRDDTEIKREKSETLTFG